MSSHFRRYGKKLMKWAKVKKAKNAARASAGEKTEALYRIPGQKRRQTGEALRSPPESP